MVKNLLIVSLFFILLSAKYLTNKDCNECHQSIYDEYQTSYHSKTYFNDELHRKVADKASLKTYDCASCHMPAANNLKELISGKARPDSTNKTHKDAISCFYCHQIAFVKKAHEKNEIILARQAEGYKPTLYGSLQDPEQSDKHTMTHSPIYEKYACNGCHSHKRNSHDVMIFDAMSENEDSTECIKCHMPSVNGKVEDMDKKNRKTHHSHKFLGIHDKSMREKSVDIGIKVSKNTLNITLHNKMSHSLIIHPARLKYLKITISRKNKIIWQNFKTSPLEDKKASFVVEFKDKDDKAVSIPAFAYKLDYENNLKADGKKVLKYKVSNMKKGDVVKVSMFVILSKPSCSNELNLKDKNLIKPLLMKETTYKL
jgi:hypothetical protein